MTESTIIALSRVDVGYEDAERPVVAGVDLSIERDSIVTIIGGSGSGKSTLLRAMTGLLAPLRGQVCLFGEDIYALPPRARGRLLSRTGVVFQHDALFGSLTVLENVMFPVVQVADIPRPVALEMARIKLGLLGIAELADRMPSDISGGQRKRAALARATVLDPEVVFCDEPTSGLDPINAHLLARLLVDLRDTQGTTIVAATHDMQTVRLVSDRTVVLADGAIRAVGTPDDLVNAGDRRVRAFFRGNDAEHDMVADVVREATSV